MMRQFIYNKKITKA